VGWKQVGIIQYSSSMNDRAQVHGVRTQEFGERKIIGWMFDEAR
jgi:hypothetical protein